MSSKPRNPNRDLGTHAVLLALRDTPEAFAAARVVGHWVWCEFRERPGPDVLAALKELGFHWNKRREAWQHPCGRFSRSAPGDPRARYGSVPAAALDLETVAT